MPVTDTLKTAAELKLAGFPENQATLLAEKFEETAKAVSEDLKSFIRAEFERNRVGLDHKLGEFDHKLGELRSDVNHKIDELRAEFNHKFDELRVELHSSLRDQTFKVMAILIAALSLAVAIIKLFPNAH